MEKINFYTQSSLDKTPELRMVIDVSGNVGIGESNPTKALEVAGDISFNGNLYQNGTLFQSGGGGGLTDLSATSISDLSDVSFNSTSTTQGNSLIWNNTDKVWESGTPTTSIVNTTTTVTNTTDWQELTTTGGPPPERYGGAVVTYQNKLIVSGGISRSAASNTWELNLDTNVWTEKTSLTNTTPSYSEHVVGIRYNNKMIVWGGYGSSPTYDMWELNLDTYQWSDVTPSGINHPNRNYTAVLWGSKIVYYSGYVDARSQYESTVTEVNIGTTPYTAITKIAHGASGSPNLGGYPNSAVYQDKMYVYGGRTGGTQLWELNLQNYTWTQKTYTGTGPANNTERGMTVEHDGNMYIFGGFDSSTTTFFDQFVKLDLTTFTFTNITTTTKPSPRLGIMGPTVKYNNKMYLFGGDGGPGLRENDTWAYTFPTTITTYNPVEINKLSTYYALSVGPNYDTSNMDNSGNLIVEGNVGIGISDPSGYKLEVAGDISFNGNLYQNGALFTGGSTIDETTDVSMNNTTIHGILDVSTNFTAGGRTSTTTTTSETIPWYTNQSNFTWSLTNDGTSTAPTARKNHSSIIDNSSNIVVFGGYDSNNSETNDVWKYNITNNSWSQLFTSTTPSDGAWDQITGSTATSIFDGATAYNNEIYVISDSHSKFEKYNPSTNTWTTLSIPSGASFISYHHMVAYNEHIYSVDSVNGYRSVWDYNISTDTWTQISNVSDTSHDRYVSNIMVYNNYIYIYGGRHTPYTDGFFNDIWKFNLTNNTWSEITGTTVTLDGNSSSMPSIGYAYFTSKDDNLYMFGGSINNTRSNILYIYNVTNNILTGYTTSISVRSQGAASIQDNYLYLFGGYDGSNLNELIKYDLNAHTYTTISQSGTWPSARYDFQQKSVTIGNTFYLIGGRTTQQITEIWRYTLDDTPNKMKHSSSVLNGDEIVTIFGGSNGNVYYNSIYNFNLVSNSWSYSTVVKDNNASDTEHGNSSGAPSSRDGHTSVEYNNKMYMFGGKDGSTTYYDTWEYDLTSTTWTKKALAPSSYARYEHTSIIYNGDMYVFGGYDGSNYFNNILKYDITNDTWSEYNDGTTSGTPTARYGHISVIMQNEMIIFGGTTQSGNVEDSYMFNFVDNSWNLLDNDDSNRPTDSYSTTAEIQYYNPSDNHYKLFVFGGETPLTNKLYVADISRNNVTNTTSTTIPNILTFNSTNGRVGIGTNTPNKSLDVGGDINFTGSLYQNGSIINIGSSTFNQNTNLTINTLTTVNDISFGGNLYQNGALFTGGSTIDETTDVSLNNLKIHGDLSANDASFNVIDTTSLRINGVDIIDGAPAALDTLSELAAALDNSANFATNVLTTLSNKQDTLTAGTNITITGTTISASGGLTDLSATSISDLSDVSFNPTTTTQGSSLIWNNTDKVWESGTPTTSIVNTTTTVTNSGGWVDKNPTNEPAYHGFGDLVYDGNDGIYFVGGWENSSTRRNYVWKYTISTNTWGQITTSGTFASAISSHSTVFYNNSLYVFGGNDGSNLNTLYKLDLLQSTPTWSLISTSGTISARREQSAGMYNSKLIIFGGYVSGSVNDVYEIDLASQTPTWVQLHNGSGTAPSGRYAHVFQIYQNKAIIFSGGGVADCWEFNLLDNTWNQVTMSGTIPSVRSFVGDAMIGTDIYVYGGYSGRKSDFYKLDVTTYTWTQITNNTVPGMEKHGATFANGKFYVYGNNGSTTGYTYEYTIPTTTTTYNPVEINKLSTYYALSVGPNYDTSNMDNSGNLIVEGNVGIGLTDPSGYKLEVAGDISFNGSLYQNGALFTGGSTIDETTDVSLNNLIVHGDISGSNDMLLNGRITIAKEERDQTPVYDTEYQITFNGGNSYNNWILYNTSNSNGGNVPVNTDWTIEYSHKITIGNGENHAHFAIVLKEDGISSTDFGNNTYFMYYATFPNSLVFRYHPADSTNQTDSIPTFTWSSFSEFVDVKWQYTTSNNTMILYFNGSIVASISNLTNSSKIYGTWGFGEWNDNTHHLINPRITHGGTTYTITTVNSTSSTAPTVSTSTTNTTVIYAMDVSGKAIFSDSVTANGSVLSSDDRIKHNEQPITNALSTISKITPKHYFKTGSTLYDATHNFPLNSQNQPLSASGTPLLLNKDYTLETGIIAQELRSIPELSFAVQNTTPLGVDYNSIHCTHIAATKELHQLVQSQQTQIEEQQNEIEHLKMVNIDMNNQLVSALQQLEHIKRYLAI